MTRLAKDGDLTKLIDSIEVDVNPIAFKDFKELKKALLKDLFEAYK